MTFPVTRYTEIEISDLFVLFRNRGTRRVRVIRYRERITPFSQLVQFFHDMVSNLDRALNQSHRQTDLIIMDFAKAFDKVRHRRLLYKLHYYGIRGSTHQWIASWLSERFQKVVLDGQA